MDCNMFYHYVIEPEAVWKIESFYMNVALKYRHTYSYEDMEKDVNKAYFNAFGIERTLLRRKPTPERWQHEGWHMANAGTWYYAYIIDGDTIKIQDTCHEQNMHE